MNRGIWTGRVLPTLGLLVAVAGFGVSIYLSVNQSPEPSGPELTGPDATGLAADGPESIKPAAKLAATGPEPSGPAAPPGGDLTGADFPAAALDVGHQVGYQIPDFTLELADGAAITSAGLAAAERPAFLFFFATT